MNQSTLTRRRLVFYFLAFVIGVVTDFNGKCGGSTQKTQADGTTDQKPVLKRARLETLGLDDWPGSSLHLKIDGEYRDLAGLRIKEQHVDVNGTTFTIKEDYPVWIDSPPAYSPTWDSSSVDVHFRQRKDEKRWRKYLEDVRMRRELAAKNKEAQDAGEPLFEIETKKMGIPPVWLSLPEANNVRVFVSVYDKSGNESEAVEIEDVLDWLISPENTDEFLGDSTDYYHPGTDLQSAAHAADSTLDVDNAALLYYQAFLSRPQPDAATGLTMNSVLRGAEPDRNIRSYLKRCRQTIRLAEAATKVPQCNWGISTSGGLGSMPLADLRQLSFVLSLYAHTLAADEHYRASLESSLGIRRLARHVGSGDVITYLVSLATDRRALNDIKKTLGAMPPDADTLIWLKGQLAAEQSVPGSFAPAMESQFKQASHILRNNPNRYSLWRRELAIVADLPYDENETKDLPKILIKDAAELKETWKNLRVTDREKDEVQVLLNLTNEQLLERSRQTYEKWLNSVVRIVESDTPYEKKYAELRRLEDELNEEPNDPNSILYNFDPNDIFLMPIYSEPTRIYGQQVQHEAELNALTAAIGIYLTKAEMGRLPDSLPTGLPKDPFSGQDFEYEVTKDGFALRCRARDLEASPTEFRPGQPPKILSDKYQQYEFKVRK